MPEAVLDPALLARLPMPLARLGRDAHNARNPQELHQSAYYLWEFGLKLLGSSAIATIAKRQPVDPAITKKLSFLSRPSLGHWHSIIRDLPAILATDDSGFAAVHALLTGKARDDLPRCAGLDAALRNSLTGKGGSKTTVQVGDLFDRLVTYRNDTIGHGAVGRHGESFYETMGQALLAARDGTLRSARRARRPEAGVRRRRRRPAVRRLADPVGLDDGRSAVEVAGPHRFGQ